MSVRGVPSGRPVSPAQRAHLNRMRAERARKRREREARGGDWRNGHWLTSESVLREHTLPEEVRKEMDEAAFIRELDFNDRAVVDWRDVDAAEEYN